MAFKGCSLHKSYPTIGEAWKHCEDGQAPAPCDRCRGYYVKKAKKRKVSQKVTYKQSGGGKRR